MNIKHLTDFARAVCEAKEAYVAFTETGMSTSSANERTPEYRRLYKAGVTLDSIGGFNAMQAALYGFYNDSKRNADAGIVLNHIWSGIGTWER